MATWSTGLIHLNVSRPILRIRPKLTKSCRAFHATPPHQFFDTCLVYTHTFFEGIHNITGLPWVATLPLAGLCLKLLILGPTLYSQDIARRRLNLQPLRLAWANFYQRDISKKHAAAGPIVCKRLISKAVAKKSGEIYRSQGLQAWRGLLPVIQLPIWVLAIETLRRMCGARNSIISWIFGNRGSEDEDVGVDPAENVAVPLELSFADEGALWFTNLLLPDPELILPFVLSATMLANLYVSPSNSKITSKWQRRVINVLKLLALAIGPMTLALPSAVHVYWISTTFMSLIQSLIIRLCTPYVPPFQACKSKMERPKLGFNLQS